MRKALTTLLTFVVGLTALATVFVAPANAAQIKAAAGYRTVAYLYSDANYGGFVRALTFTDYGDCDNAGYRFTDTWGGSRFRLTSSVSNSSTSPGCNAAVVTTTYGGTQLIRIPTAYVGNALNDQFYSIRVCRYPC